MGDDGSERLARSVHWTLLGGVCLSGALLAIGLILFFWRGQPSRTDVGMGVAAALNLKNIEDGTCLMQLGLLILIATPMLRVLVLAVGWTIAKERRFALVAWTVLALLGTSLILGLG